MRYLTAFLLVSVANGFSSFKESIPNGDKVRNCENNLIGGVGHHAQCLHGDCPTKGGGVRNQFGEDFANHGFMWTKELCDMDSDGDGKSNGLELGDPDCEWVPGQVPKVGAGITHPGENCVSSICKAEPPRAQENSPPGCTKYEHGTTHKFPMVFPGNHKVPFGTSYINLAFNQPADAAPMMITKFEHVINDTRVLHHMVLFRCLKDMTDVYPDPREGTMRGCPEELMVWAIGGQDFCTPEGIGFPILPGEHFVIQIHYDNPRGHTDIRDHSGMIMHGVPRADAMDLIPARTWMLGPSFNKLEIPPRKPIHRITAVMDPLVDVNETEDVVIFAYLQHLHLLGKKQWLIAEKPDGTTEEVLCDTNYNFDLQETRYFPVAYRVSPGTKLTLECVWDSSDRSEPTPGGEATEEEMCFLFIYFTGYQGLSAVGQTVGYVLSEFNTSDEADKYCGCAEGWAPPPSDSNFGRRVSILLAHGVAMIVAWGLLLPLGAVVPLAWRKALPEQWFSIHRGLQLAGAAAMTVGFALAFSVTESHFDINVPHKIVGLGIFVLAIAQTLGGLFRPHKSESGDSQARSTWLMLHRILAGLLIAGSILQCVGGAFLFGEFQPDYGSLSTFSTTALLICFAGGWLVVLLCLFAGKSKESTWQKQVDIEETELPAAS